MSVKLPNDVTKLNGEALSTLLTSAQEEFDALLALDDPTDADVTEAERLDSIVKTLRVETQQRQTSAAERAARMNALRSQPGDPDPDDEGDDNDPEQPAPPSVAADGAPVLTLEPSPTLYAEDLVQAATETDAQFAVRQARYPHRPADTPVADISTLPPTQASTVEVVAAAPTGFVAQVARNTARPVRPARADGVVSIRAAADVPDFPTGANLDDMVGVAKATINRMQGFPAFTGGQPDGQMSQYGVATFRKPFDPSLVASGHEDAYEVIMRASKETNLPGQSLTAAGGWCAPSEVIYDLCQDETTDGMLSIPEIQISRGGIRYTQGPNFSTIYNNVGFCQTEAEAIAGTTKPCYTVPCPAFTEVRLDVCGLCIKVPILQNAAYPELTARVISGALIAHQHKMNAKVIAAIATALGAAVTMPDLKSTAQNSFNAVALVAESLRSQYRLGFNRAMEVVAPHWLLSAIQADLSFRMGLDSPANVSQADINGAFANRGVAIQWVEDWQPLPVGCPNGYPATVNLLVYPSGAFVKGVSDVIRLNAVYDAASLSVNEYIGLFFEEGILVTQTCYTGCQVTIPLCQAGTTGAASNAACYTGS